MAEDLTKKSSNNNEEKKDNKDKNTLLEKIKKHKIIAGIIIATIIVIIISVSDYHNKKKNAKEDPNDPKNGPAAANEFINNVYLDEEGKLRTEKSIRELWDELKKKGNNITKYLSSPQELAKLFSASMATDYPDTRPPSEIEKEIDWDKLDLDVDSTEVQGIVKFKRALASNEKITMTYLSPSKFQEKINKYNSTGKAEDRDEALKYFTIERTLASSGTSSSSSGLVDLGPRTYNSDTFHFTDHIDIYDKTGGLFGRYDAVQGCCFDGKNIICSVNTENPDGSGGDFGGKVFWFNIETKKYDSTTVDIGKEGGHMEGTTYDSQRKIVLLVSKKDNTLIQIDNNTKQRINDIKVPENFRQLAYSVTTQQLLGYNDSKRTISFMKYKSDTNEYVEERKINLQNNHFTNIQGMSCDGQVIYLSDSRPKKKMNPDNYRIWVYDFQGNKVEEHKMGDEYNKGTKECENCFVDEKGNMWVMLPHEVARVNNYKANPVDWENNVASNSSTGTGTTIGGNAKVEEILQYACSWIGKISYDLGADGKLVKGGKSDCSHFVFRVYEHFGLMDKFVRSLNWGKGGENGGCPGTKNIGTDMSKASPGDVIWEHYGSGSHNHVYIYMGKDKNGKYKKVQCANTDHAQGVYISNVNTKEVDAILHFDALPDDPTAYFDPETGELHSSSTKTENSTSNTSSSSGTTGGFSAPTQSGTSSQTSTSNSSSSSSSNSNSNGFSVDNFKASGQDIVNEAEKYVGKIPYVWGGQYLDQRGADCSGFAWAILTKLKLITWGRGPDTVFRDKGTEVKDISEAVSGDILCFNGHIAIFKGNKGDGMNGYMVEALNEQSGIVNNRKVSEERKKLITIRRFTNNTSGSSTSTTALGPVNTDEVFGQFSEETRQIILAHRNDFDESNFKEFFRNYQGGYNQYLKDLGGVFAKYGGRDTPMNVTDAGTFQEVAEYTWGLFAIWGFNYYNGDFRVRWGKDNKEVAQSAFYKGSDSGHYSSGHIDDICSDLGRVNSMRTNCNYGSNAFLQKCGLTEDKNFTTHWKRGQHIDNPEDLQIGDLVHFFSSDGEWHHVAVVGEVDPELGPILYDSGNRFIRSGNYKFPYNSNKYSKYPIKRGRRYFNIDQSTSGRIGSGTPSNSNAKYVFKVKVATWQEEIVKVESTTNKEYNSRERNFNMNTKTIPYQDIVAQYRMPFNYLWTNLLYSQDKKYTFDLANLVRNSQIEITIHDNLQDTETIVTESHTTKYHHEGEADVKFNYTNKIITEAPTVQPPFAQPEPTVTTSQGSLIQHGKGTADSSKPYSITTTTRNIVNTLDIALTLADTWCVKFEKEYEFDGTKEDSPPKSVSTFEDIVDDEQISPISNSELLNNVIENAKQNAIKELIDQGKTASIDSNEVLSSTDNVTVTITDRKTSTKTNTTTKKYTAKPEKYDLDDTPKFAIVFNRHYNARSNILSAKAWFFEALESNADTVNMVDLTKYLMYKATGTNYGATDFYAVFNKLKQNYTNISGQVAGETGGTSGIDGNPGKVYDFLLSKGVPAVGAAAIMGNIENESNFSTTVVNSIGASGLCQWYQGRATALKEFAKTKNTDWTDLNTQLEFMWRELDTSYTKVKSTIMSASAEEDLEYATWYWGSYFETYDSANQVGYETSRQWKEEKERYASAQKWYYDWKQKHTSSGTSSTSAGSDTSTDISQAILSKANANSTPWPGKNMCLQWVDDVYSRAGINPDRKSTAFRAWKAHGISTDKNNIPIGAAVYGTGVNSEGAGHVGIYIGNGKVVDSVSSGINTSTLDQWISWQTDTIEGYRGWLGWGWEDGNRTRGLK